MGIRFFCPNGHKLNVKEFQAGRTGICPFCGVKMQIPLKSTRPSSKQERQHASAAPSAAQTAAEEKFPSPELGRPTADGIAPIPAAQASADPLIEGGQSVWYVRPSSGGQFGPAAPDVMRIWLDEGRIAADSLVWREGWPDWQVGGDVFPQLSQGPMIPGMEIVLSEPAVSPMPISPTYRRRPARGAQLAVIGALIFAVIVLFAILLVVLKQ